MKKNSFAKLLVIGLLIVLCIGCSTQSSSGETSFLADRIFRPLKEKTLKEKILSEIGYYANGRQVRFLMSLSNPDEIYTFREKFWKEFDPTPRTAVNEFRIEHYLRLEYVNKYYPEIRGWGKSDRGRVYILYGPPDEIVTNLWFNSEDYKSYEIWLYNKPAGNNLLAMSPDIPNSSQMQFMFANKQFLEKYTQVFSTEDGELCDPRLIEKMTVGFD